MRDTRRLVVYALLSAALVALAFLRAELSSTGIRITGDGLHYADIARRFAESGGLAGQAPFVYRPLVPMLAGFLPGEPLAGFTALTAASLLAGLLLLWPTAPDSGEQQHGREPSKEYATARRPGPVAFVLAPLLLVDYQVLFAAANPARLDAFVFALQLGLVALAARGRRGWFFLLLVPVALVKESLILGLLPLALAAFPANRRTGRLAVASGAGFLGLHLAVRGLATVEGSAVAYQGGWPDPAAALELLASHLGLALPLVGLAALGGLLVPALVVMVRACRRPSGHWIAAFLTLGLVVSLAAAVDVHRAWFELALPLSAWGLVRALEGCDRRRLATFGGLALAAGLLPYGAVVLGTEHLYLESVRALAAGGLPPAGPAALGLVALALSGAAAWFLPRAEAPVSREEPA